MIDESSTKPPEKDIPIRNLLAFWEASLQEHRTQMTPSTIHLTEQTIKRLKELEVINGSKTK